MGAAQTIQAQAGAAEPTARRRWWRLPDAPRPTLRHVRTRRIALVLILVWIVGVFDLVFTLTALRLGGFQEANPLARQFIDSPAMLATFKFATLAYATPILLVFSRRRLTEIGCWVVGIVHVALAFLWLAYYHLAPAGR
jgi:hypothetical protein